MMSLEAKIFKGVSWMAFFNFFSQGFSWAITIAIARILSPGDYGLMAMSTIIIGYALGISELGLGNAIIQRLNVSKQELSSVFWFSTFLTSALAIACFPISFLTAALMHEPRVIPLTQTVAIVFILNGLQIVPSSLIRKEMDFKSIGLIDMNCTIISSLCMFLIAKLGGGVWTLIFGSIIRSFLRMVLLFIKSRWRPAFHFNFAESKPFLSFGILLAIARSLFYVQEKSDTFFAGRAWKSQVLGYYSFATQLAQIPTEKIVSLVNNLSFPAFSKLQNDPVAFNKLYLNITKVTAAIVCPLFSAGFFLGEDLIRLLLDPKWYPMIYLFRILCLVQILISLNSINSFVHAAQGRPKWSLFYNSALVVVMPVSFYFAVRHGLNAMAVPWTTSYLILCLGWIYISIRKFGIPLHRFLLNMMHPVFGTMLMSTFFWAIHGTNIFPDHSGRFFDILFLSGLILIGAGLYCAYFWFIDRDFVFGLRRLLKR